MYNCVCIHLETCKISMCVCEPTKLLYHTHELYAHEFYAH